MASAVMDRELTDEEIAKENQFLAGLPRINLGALFFAPIWGPAHGLWAAFLFYPLWIFVDNSILAAVQEPGPLTIGGAVLLTGFTLAACVVFAIVSQPMAAHRAESMGVSRQRYLKREKIWAIGGFIAAVAVVALATWYNLYMR